MNGEANYMNKKDLLSIIAITFIFLVATSIVLELVYSGILSFDAVKNALTNDSFTLITINSTIMYIAGYVMIKRSHDAEMDLHYWSIFENIQTKFVLAGLAVCTLIVFEFIKH